MDFHQTLCPQNSKANLVIVKGSTVIPIYPILIQNSEFLINIFNQEINKRHLLISKCKSKQSSQLANIEGDISQNTKINCIN